jgi:CRP-like cAMP-binding protein
MTRVRQLQTFPLFSACSVRDLSRIDSLTSDLHVEAGRVLTRTGHPGYEFFIVIDGTATAWYQGVELNRLGPGSFFGELALLSGHHRMATVVADSEMHLLVMSVQEFRSPYFQIEPVKDVMLATVVQRLSRTNQGSCRPGFLPDPSSDRFAKVSRTRDYEDRPPGLWREGVPLINRL